MVSGERMSAQTIAIALSLVTLALAQKCSADWLVQPGA
jgi:hypothetical protein